LRGKRELLQRRRKKLVKGGKKGSQRTIVLEKGIPARKISGLLRGLTIVEKKAWGSLLDERGKTGKEILRNDLLLR